MQAQTKVGALFLAALAGTVALALALGSWQPFSRSNDLRVAYNFAGGIEVGSPVRVMGIKVGKVRSIDFTPQFRLADTGEEVKLTLTVSISKEAWPTIRADSRFYINLAGVIGEKFLEISPGGLDRPALEPGQVVRGEDPPRIDQMISQSYALAGKLLEFVNKNEGSVISTIETANKLVINFEKMLKQFDKTSKDPTVHRLIANLGSILDDGAFFGQKMRGPDATRTFGLINDLVHRLEPLDAKAIKKFFQDEGIRARLF